MITLDFYTAIAVYLSIAILLVIGPWIFYTCNDTESMIIESKYLRQCPYCTHLFFDYAEEKLTMCPRCESYVALEDTTKTGLTGEREAP